MENEVKLASSLELLVVISTWKIIFFFLVGLATQVSEFRPTNSEKWQPPPLFELTRDGKWLDHFKQFLMTMVVKIKMISVDKVVIL